MPREKKKTARRVNLLTLKPAPEKSLWIYLVGGARFKVDDVNETADGAWYHRGTVSVFWTANGLLASNAKSHGQLPPASEEEIGPPATPYRPVDQIKC